MCMLLKRERRESVCVFGRGRTDGCGNIADSARQTSTWEESAGSTPLQPYSPAPRRPAPPQRHRLPPERARGSFAGGHRAPLVVLLLRW